MSSKATFFSNRSEMDALVAQLKVLGIHKVGIEFEGSGDSGSIEYVYFYGADDVLVDVDKDTISWTLTTYGDKQPKAQTVPLYKAMEDIGYRVLDATGVDWYNNEGGQGQVYLKIVGDTIKVEVNMEINVTQTEDHTFEYGVDGVDDLDDDANFFPQTSEEK